MSNSAVKVAFCVADLAFLAAGHCWMAHGNEFAGNIFKFVVWLSFALSIVVTILSVPMRSDPFTHSWRAWMGCFAVAKVLLAAGFGQFTLAAVMTADSALLWTRVREWDLRAHVDNKQPTSNGSSI